MATSYTTNVKLAMDELLNNIFKNPKYTTLGKVVVFTIALPFVLLAFIFCAVHYTIYTE